ncbi:MAG TPA: hypothetical protein DEP01_05740 [Aminobacterium sp.]|uniref:hypothetical protein n=1 Tax=Aminobacterium mobile TaxID=81467 RepID=UPI000EC625A4|nr:hypothetical protein [Aminobacterium sp.]
MNNPVFEPLLNQAQITVDSGKRAAVLQKAWDRFYEVHPIAPLAIADEIYGGRKDLVGMWKILQMGRLTIREIFTCRISFL